MFPEWFAPRQPDWPKQMEQTGFPLWDEAELMEPQTELEAFLAEGEPPIVFTLSSTAWRAREFYEAAASACRSLGCRGVLLAANGNWVPDTLPAGVRHFSYVPFRQLLPRARALVHHGGLGTGALAMAAGLPQVVRPCVFDQPDNAERLRRLGVSETLKVKEITAERLARTLERVLGCGEMKRRSEDAAARIRQSVALEDTAVIVEASAEAASLSRQRGRAHPIQSSRTHDGAHQRA